MASAQAELARLLVPWHPRYRRALMILLGLAVVVGGIEFGQNVVVEQLSLAFRPQSADDAPARAKAPGSEGAPAEGAIAEQSTVLEFGPALLMLSLLIGLSALRVVRDLVQRIVSGRLRQRGWMDLERTVLDELLRRDDAFFIGRSYGELLNRFSGDIQRIVEHRDAWVARWEAVLCILANVSFFSVRDPWLAVPALAACVLGTIWTLRLTRPTAVLDGEFLAADDRVKAYVEDALRAVPEVQVEHLSARVQAGLATAQEARRSVARRFTWVYASIGMASGSVYVITLAAMLLAILAPKVDAQTAERLALLPVILRSLPGLFACAALLVDQRLASRFAASSGQRILEVMQAPSAPRHTPGPPSDRLPTVAPSDGGMLPLRCAAVVYRYGAAAAQGPPVLDGVSHDFLPGRWVALVGGAGSGKSTLLSLLLGRLEPAAGQVLLGGRAVADLSAEERGERFSLLPQTPVLLDDTIGANLDFGRRVGSNAIPADLDADDLALVDALGLGEICRARALDLCPKQRDSVPGLEPRLVALRARLRARLAEDAVVVRGFEQDAGRRAWLIERLLGGRCNRPAAISALLGPGTERTLAHLERTQIGAAIILVGRHALSQTAGLLAQGDALAYNRVARVPLEAAVWELRARVVGAVTDPGTRRGRALDLLRVGLTTRPDELGSAPGMEVLSGASQSLTALRSTLGVVTRAFDADRIHPWLSWRENLVFGELDAPNHRAAQRVDAALLATLQGEGLSDWLTRVGLGFEVGRGGGRLSGGQRQLVAMCRALLRRTEVTVLDEPTSALDPERRERVAHALAARRPARILVTVSHDPEFVRHADEVLVLDAGRVAACGSPGALLQDSAVFQRILRVGPHTGSPSPAA